MFDVSDIIATLEDVSEKLRDKSLALLTDAVTSGATQRPPEDKSLAQAQRSIEKAISVLRRI